MHRYRLEIVVFICGSVVMILELVGSRIVAPFLGTSLHVWTSLIGVILASLSLGYWWGGRQADRHPTYRRFGWLIAASGCYVGLVGIASQAFLGFLSLHVTDIRWGALLAALILFAPASVLLGTVSPFAVRLKMQTLAESGATVGRLYAISTIGSIVGTFFAGFFLISFLGSVRIILLLAVILAATGFFAARQVATTPFFRGICILLTVAMAVAGFWMPVGHAAAIFDIDTPYSRVIVEEKADPNSGRIIRYMRVDQGWGQSAVYVKAPDELCFEYNRFYRLAEHFVPDQKQALLIGGGAYSFPRDYLLRNPRAVMDVVEIDPELTRLAGEHFFLEPDPRMNIFHADGRIFLAHPPRKYDTVYIDVFKSAATPPFHLTTREVFQQVHASLATQGVLLINLFCSLEGDTGRMLRAVNSTLEEVFAWVAVYPVQFPRDDRVIQNFILVAGKSEVNQRPPILKKDLAAYLNHRWQTPIRKDVPVLTDDFAPVEHYLVPVLQAMQP